MNYEEFMKNIGHVPAKIIASVNKKDTASISMEGRGLELLALSLDISKSVIQKAYIDVDDYCNMLKQGIKGKIDDSKAYEESKEHSKAISREQFTDAYKQVLRDVLDDKDIDVKEKVLASLLVTKYVNQMCEKLFGEGLKNE
jgi:hypothetical protein